MGVECNSKSMSSNSILLKHGYKFYREEKPNSSRFMEPLTQEKCTGITMNMYLHISSSPSKPLSQQIKGINGPLGFRGWPPDFSKCLSYESTIEPQYIVACPYSSCCTHRRPQNTLAAKMEALILLPQLIIVSQ